MEVLQVNSPLSQANGSEKKVCKVYVLKLGQYVASHVADSAFCEKKNRVGHLNTIFALGGGNLNKTIFKRSNARGIEGEGKFEASN